MAGGVLEDASANCAATRLETHAAAAQEVGNRGYRFTGVPAVRAYRQDQISEREVLFGFFHGWVLG